VCVCVYVCCVCVFRVCVILCECVYVFVCVFVREGEVTQRQALQQTETRVDT